MTLAGRLSWFFLSALALVLVGFSVSLYLLARSHLYREAGDRLTATLATMAAVVDVDREGLEWEGNQHHLTLGSGDGPDKVRWEVRDEQSRCVDRSANLGSQAPWGNSTLAAEGAGDWLVATRRLEAGKPVVRPDRHAALVLTAGICLRPVHATLRWLGWSLGGLSAGLWLAAALAGRRLCRQALAPVATMATAARTMGALDLSERLPGPGTNDELADLGRSFNGLLDRLQEAFERQRRFTGDASHQLRTPLAAMLGQVEVALRRERSTSEYREALTQIQGQADHLRRVVEALLFLARADAEADPGGLELLDLAAWVPAHLESWQSNARGADVRWEAPPSGTLVVRAQPTLLGALLDNLLENACKFSPPGSPISVRLGRDDGWATLAVEDRGSGIPAVDLPHVFAPFYRSAEARRQGQPGVGLGLSVARRIAEAFGGRLAATSEADSWTCMTLSLPEAQADQRPE